MKELTRMEYMYIIIIIILFSTLAWVALPFVYSQFNGNVDAPDCITDVDTIQCGQVDNINICVYNCTYKNGSIVSRYQRGGI